MEKAELENLRIVKVGGQAYLGQIAETKGVITLSNAMEMRALNSQTIQEYLVAEHMGDLETLTLRGNAAFTEKALNEAQVLEFGVEIEVFAMAEKLAPKNLVCTEYLNANRS